ncbi:MAG: hypothetical protein R3D00_25650 [Bacteroidia bacterium]
MSIREILLKDIQEAPPALLKPLFEVWQVLKSYGSKPAKSQKHAMNRYFAVISPAEAEEIQQVIDEEFGKIDGD